MTTITASSSTPVTAAGARVDRVRRIVRADAALCAGSGAVLVAGASPLADLAGLDPVWPVTAAGVFLVVLALGLVALGRASATQLVRLTPWSADGDLVWAAASLAVAFGVSLTGTGRVLIAAQGLVVAGVGVTKLLAVRAAR